MYQKILFRDRLLALLMALVLAFSIVPPALAVDDATEHIHEEPAMVEEVPDTEVEIVAAEPKEPIDEGFSTPVVEEPVPPVVEDPIVDTPVNEPEEVEEIQPLPVEPVTSGSIGDSAVLWRFDASSGRLLISGSGDCDIFTSAADQPWAHLRSEIKEAYFTDVASLSIFNLAHWFEGCSSLRTAEIPYTTFRIGARAFADCPNLTTIITNYYDSDEVSITPGAFAVSGHVDTNICLIADQPIAIWRLMSYDWNADNRHAQAINVHGTVLLVGPCGISGCTCSSCSYYTEASEYNLDTGKNNSSRHWVYTFCSRCDAFVYHGYENHTFRNGECTECGYVEECDHVWRVDYYEPYSSTRHYVYYYCRYCDETYSEREYHSEAYEYSKYSSSQHLVTEYCEDCEDELDSYYESHSFSYGSWSSYSSTQHRRLKTCSDCGYSTYEYANHGLSYGSWKSASSTQHTRTASCITCSYSTTETASHSISYSAWTSLSDTQHQRTASCSACAYSTTESASHSLVHGKWESVSDTEHSRSTSCSCGYTETETEAHALLPGTWVPRSAEEHERTDPCACGYETTLSAAHADNDADGFCDDCNYAMTRFSVTVPATMVLVMSENGEVYAAQNASIVNHSSGDVAVTNVTISTEGQWTLVPYTHDMAAEKVDAHCIGFALNNAASTVTGHSEALSLPGDWTIAQSDELPLSYDAVVSATSEAIHEEQVLSLVFVVDWAA